MSEVRHMRVELVELSTVKLYFAEAAVVTALADTVAATCSFSYSLSSLSSFSCLLSTHGNVSGTVEASRQARAYSSFYL